MAVVGRLPGAAFGCADGITVRQREVLLSMCVSCSKRHERFLRWYNNVRVGSRVPGRCPCSSAEGMRNYGQSSTPLFCLANSHRILPLLPPPHLSAPLHISFTTRAADNLLRRVTLSGSKRLLLGAKGREFGRVAASRPARSALERFRGKEPCTSERASDFFRPPSSQSTARTAQTPFALPITTRHGTRAPRACHTDSISLPASQTQHSHHPLTSSSTRPRERISTTFRHASSAKSLFQLVRQPLLPPTSPSRTHLRADCPGLPHQSPAG